MRVQVNPSDLAAALSTVGHAIPSRTPAPILGAVFLHAQENGDLHLTATDLDLTISVGIKTVVEEPGDAVLPYRYFFDIIRHLSSSPARLEVDEGSFGAIIRWEKARYEVNGYDPTQYPALPARPGEEGIHLSDASLRLWSRQTVFAAANDISRPTLTGVWWEWEQGTLRLVATDGTRLAYREASVPSLQEERKTMLVPSRAMQQVLRMPSSGRDVTVRMAANHIWFEWEEATLSCRLLAGQYPDYRQVMPRRYLCQARLNRSAFHDACYRASLLSREGFPAVLLEFGEGRILVTSSSPAVGRGEEEVEAEVEGQPLQLAFNANLLLEGLKVLEGEEVLFAAAGPQAVCALRDAARTEYLYFVLPLKQS